MGGRGTYAADNYAPFTYETVDIIEGVKVLEKLNKKDSINLPEEAHSSRAYILLDHEGKFKRYREYNADKTAKFDIDYHKEPKLAGHHGPVLHIHFYSNLSRDRSGRLLTEEEFKKYKKYFRGL